MLSKKPQRRPLNTVSVPQLPSTKGGKAVFELGYEARSKIPPNYCKELL